MLGGLIDGSDTMLFLGMIDGSNMMLFFSMIDGGNTMLLLAGEGGLSMAET